MPRSCWVAMCVGCDCSHCLALYTSSLSKVDTNTTHTSLNINTTFSFLSLVAGHFHSLPLFIFLCLSPMACAVVPAIHISPAPPQVYLPEPYSPFNSLSFPEQDKDAFRPDLLTPPPTHTAFSKHLSPLCPPDAPLNNKGLERERFEALLKTSKERNALVGAKKAVDLRKEIAYKAHRNKLGASLLFLFFFVNVFAYSVTAERRALFLSKITAPPSPTATGTPKTPPDSPAIFHYSLPSPGLVSPLALFDSIQENSKPNLPTCHPYIEHVDFRLPNEHNYISRITGISRVDKAAQQVLPSLDQISARLKTLASTRSTTIVDGLCSSAAAPFSAPSNRPATIEIGRLKMPVRALNSNPVSVSQPTGQRTRRAMPPPKPSVSPFPSDPHVTTTIVPKSIPTSSAQLTETNLKILDARERRAHDMLSTLRRRTLSLPQQQSQIMPIVNNAMPGSLTRNAARRTMPLPLSAEVMDLDMDGRKSKWKRHSAPADLIQRERIGFEHPALAYPGAF